MYWAKIVVNFLEVIILDATDCCHSAKRKQWKQQINDNKQTWMVTYVCTSVQYELGWKHAESIRWTVSTFDVVDTYESDARRTLAMQSKHGANCDFNFRFLQKCNKIHRNLKGITKKLLINLSLSAQRATGNTETTVCPKKKPDSCYTPTILVQHQ